MRVSVCECVCVCACMYVRACMRVRGEKERKERRMSRCCTLVDSLLTSPSWTENSKRAFGNFIFVRLACAICRLSLHFTSSNCQHRERDFYTTV